MTNTDRAPSAVTHECPGGCGRDIEARWFACTKCFRTMPHHLRQGITQTSRRKYLDADRLAAIHAAEDWFEAQAAKANAAQPTAVSLERIMQGAIDSALGKQ